MAGEAWYLVDDPPVVGQWVLAGAEGRHAATVRRTRIGERLVLTDGRGAIGVGVVTGVDRSAVTVLISEVDRIPAPTLTVTVVQALPKGDRSELAVELATEAGADRIVAWQAERCVARWAAGGKAAKGLARWRAVAEAAAKQSRRAWLPEVTGPASTREVAALLAGVDVALVLHEESASPLADVTLADVRSVAIVVGPEGGIGADELDLLGASAVHLGPTVLRTSTAAAVALGALGVLTGRWSTGPGA